MSIFRLYGTARFAKIDIFDKELWVLSGLIVFLLIDKSISHTAPKFKVNSLLVVGIQPIRKRERAWWPRGRNSTTGTILSLFNSHIPKFQVWVKMIHSYLNTFILLYFNWSNLHMSINHIIWSIYIICFNMGCLIDYMGHKIWTFCEKEAL